MMGKFVFILGLFCCSAAYAHILHVGDKTFALDTVKRTSPALGVGIDGGVFYGAFYSGAAPEQTLHVRRDTSEYWLGQNCPAGKYSENGMSICTDCGVGYYCTGGMSRTPCTYGAMSCNTKNNTADAPMPVGAPLNKFMTLDEVNEFIPVTDFSDWQEISCCNDMHGAYGGKAETLNDVSNACATGTIGPGTYLFTARYHNPGLTANMIDAIDGTVGWFANAQIVVFDSPVAYASMHGGNGVYHHFVDTNHPQYEIYTMSSGWAINQNKSNITNLTNLPHVQNLCVFELK